MENRIFQTGGLDGWSITNITFVKQYPVETKVRVTLSKGDESRLIEVTATVFSNRRAYWAEVAKQARIELTLRDDPPGREEDLDLAWEKMAKTTLEDSDRRN